MAMNIDPSQIQQAGLGNLGQSGVQPAGSPAVGDKSFKDFLVEKMQDVNEMIEQKDQAVDDLATGKTENIAEVMTAVQKADLAFKYMMQIRSKLLDAYQELNRMQL